MRGFRIRQNVPVRGLFADIYAERADASLVIEMKRRSKFTTKELRATALRQARGYAKTLKPRYVGISDGQRLMLQYKGRICTHQLVEGAILQPARSTPCPLDLGADYFTYRDFPKKQRAQYRLVENSIIERQSPIDLEAFLVDKSLDVLFVAGDPGAGKTTFGWQLADSAKWDPLWLNASLLQNDPIETLREAKNRLTGFTGDISIFLRTLQAYRQRPRQKLTGVIVDAVDEWERVHQTLPILLGFAKSLKLKVIVLGRPQTIDFLIDDDRTLQGFAFVRRELPVFNDEEWARAEEKYIADYNLRSRFEGRAKAMSVVPEMMALIASAYEDGPIDPDLTEPRLYEAYRQRKAARLAPKTHRTPDGIQVEIYSVAEAMLEADRVSLEYRHARRASTLVDDLIVEGVLRNDGKGRFAHVRFRFGRIRDDLLRETSPNELFAKPIVGRSALTYVALNNESVRREYIRLSLDESNLEAVCLVRERDWWRDLGAMPSRAIRQPYVILGYAREKLREYPDLLSLAGADPAGLRLATIHRVETPLPLWRTWLASALDEEALHDITDLTLTLLRSNKVPLADALEAVTIIRARLFMDRLSAKEVHGFWPLVAEISRSLSPRDARRLLRRMIPPFAIAHSSINMIQHFYPGLEYSREMLAVVDELRKRCSARSFEAWASALLLNAHVTEWAPFNGKEPVGSDNDNAWLMDAIVPAMTTLLNGKTNAAVRLLSSYRISRLHPAFRLRGYIYAAPISTFGTLRRRMMSWRRMRSSGIPPLSDALDSRANESPIIAELGLDDALKRFSQPLNKAQVIAFHRRLAKGDAQAMRQATAFVSLPDFKYRDMFRTDFFHHLDWATKRPVAAARLVAAALRGGYDDLDLVRSRGHGKVFALAFTDPRVRKALDSVPGIADILAQYLHDAPGGAQAAFAMPLYGATREPGKRSIIRWAHKFPLGAAVEVLRRGLDDDAIIPEESSVDGDVNDDVPQSNSLHSDAWFGLVMCHQRWPSEFFHKLDVDLITMAKRFVSPVGMAATVIPLHRYASEYREDTRVSRAVIERLFLMGGAGGPKLRGFIASHLASFYGMMAPDERCEFWRLFWDTKTVAEGALGLALAHVDDQDALGRALRLATESPHRSSMAWTIYQSVGGKDHQLTATELEIVSALLENPDQETLLKLSYAAAELSKHDSVAATRLLLRVAQRTAETGFILYGAHLMQYDWSETSLANLEAAVASVAASRTESYAIVEIVVSGLSAKTEASDAGRISAAFEALIANHEYVREAYFRWRSDMSK
jgi:hypothetical protein